MKNLFFNLSRISELFNEKRFLYKGPEQPAPDRVQLGDAENPDRGKDRTQIAPGLAAEDTTGEAPSEQEIARNAVRKTEQARATVRAKAESDAKVKAAESYAQSGFVGLLENISRQGGVVEGRGNDKFSALRKKLLVEPDKSNPDAQDPFEKYGEYKAKIREWIAIRGTQLTQAEVNAKDDDIHTRAVSEALANREAVTPLILQAFNENEKTRKMLREGAVNLYIATELAKDKTAIDAAYNRLIADFIKIAPANTLALLPSLKVNRADALFVSNEKKEE